MLALGPPHFEPQFFTSLSRLHYRVGPQQPPKVWHDDGVIIEVIDEACKRDGFALPAGSMKAQYNNGRRYKWVTPVQAKDFLKKSTRPVPPPPLTGELFKETHNFITEWHVLVASGGVCPGRYLYYRCLVGRALPAASRSQARLLSTAQNRQMGGVLVGGSRRTPLGWSGQFATWWRSGPDIWRA